MVTNTSYLRNIILIAIIGIIVYANTFGNDFVWDDVAIEANDYIKSWKYLPRYFTTDYHSGSYSNPNFQKTAYYRPLITVFNAIDYSIWGLNLFGYHLTNLLFHILNAILVYFLINLITNKRKAAFIGGLLFVVHPVHTEAVTYISGRTDLIAAFFFLLSFLLFTGHTKTSNLRKRCFYFISSLIAFILALLSRELGIILPVILLLYYWCFCPKTRHSKKIIISYCFSFFLIAGIYNLWRLQVLSLAHQPLEAFYRDIYLRFLTGNKALISLFSLLFFPYNLHFRRYFAFSNSFFESGAFIATMILFLVLLTIPMTYRKSKAACFALLWFFITFFPVTHLFPMRYKDYLIMGEHFLYLPSIGIFLLAGMTVVAFYEKKRLIKPLVLLLICAISCLGTITLRRNIDWKNPITFYNKRLKITPVSGGLYSNLGNEYFKRKLYDKAEAAYLQAIDLEHGNAEFYYNLANVYRVQGLFEKAIANFEKAIERNPNNSGAYNNIGIIYAEEEQYDKAIDAFSKAIYLDWQNPIYSHNLNLTYEKKNKAQGKIDLEGKDEPFKASW